MKQRKISAIIPSNNNSKILSTIKSIREIVDEIIIVNSAQDSFELSNDDKVKIVHSEKGKTNASKARNIGAEKAKTEILFFIDSDVEILPESASEIKKYSAKMEEKDIYGGTYLPYKKLSILSNVNSLILRYRVISLNENKKNKIINSSHFLIHKSFFEKIGGFNEYINSYEDCDFSVRAQKIFDANVSISDQFNGYHLKDYSFVKLFLEIVKKTFYFTKLRLLFKNYYKHFTTLLDWRINILSIPLILFFLSFIFFENKIIPFILYMSGILINTILTKKIFMKYKMALYGSLIISIMSLCSYLSALLSVLILGINLFFNYLVRLKDLFICFLKVLFKYGKPIQLIQYVTARCNLRCEHCFYKETLDKPDPGELSPEILINVAKKSGPLLWYSLAGGEPFIRKDFSDIVLGVKKEAKPVVISLPSNGWYTEKTYLSCLKIMQNYYDGLFVVFISIDGPEEIHDRIRGKNSFQKLRETFKILKKLSKLYEKLHVNIVITVQDYNCKLFPGTISDLYKEFRPTSMSINLFRYQELNGPKIKDEIISGYEAAINEYEKIRTLKSYGLISNMFLKAKEKIQKDLILTVAKKKQFVTPCTAGNLSYVTMEDGSLKPCERLSDNLGSVNREDVDMDKLFYSTAAKTLRKKIKDTKCKCTFECAMSTNVLFNKDMFPKIIKQSIKDILSK